MYQRFLTGRRIDLRGSAYFSTILGMPVVTLSSDSSVNSRDAQLGSTLDRLWSELPRLRQLELGGEIANNIADRASALRYLLHHAADRPILVGLIGGASCGKSTLFDSLIARPLSRIHYQPHSSLGPVVWLHRRYRAPILHDTQPSRFLPQLTPHELAPGATATVGGVADATIALHDEDVW